MTGSVVIIGASHAAAQTCVSLRQGGWDGTITVIGDEAVLPYHRPPLSKDFLSGQKEIEDILIRPAAVYETADIKMRLGERVKSIDRAVKTVLTDKGATLNFDKLVLTTGARIRRLPVPGEDLDDVFYLRDTADVLAIKAKAETAKSALIIGGGYIGLETAASLRKQGLEVTILEAMPRILQRVTASELSSFYNRVHREEGVTILENVMASKIELTTDGLSVITACEQSFDADMVIIGIGVIPNVELADAAGLTVDNGIEVNAYCQTSDPDIYAAGDVIGWPSLASAAYDQGRAAAANMFGAVGGEFISEVPTGIYTIPEISSVGKTEAELTAEKVPYEVGRAFFKNTARAQITGEAVGMLKILFHRESLELLGIHCFGDQASEIVHIGQAIMKQPGEQNTLKYFLNTTFNYPTMAEAYRVAALNGFNRVF